MFRRFPVGVWRHHVVAVQFCACVRLPPQRHEASALLSRLATVWYQHTQKHNIHMPTAKNAWPQPLESWVHEK